MVNIARFIRAFFYFWVFGLISVLIDLDHVIQVYQDGLELNLENLAYHGTRTLHLPILILSGCLCIYTAALLIRFWNINKNKYNLEEIVNPRVKNANSKNQISPSLMLNVATSTIITTKKIAKQPGKYLIECPNCNQYFGVITILGNNELPCPHCGVIGYLDTL